MTTTTNRMALIERRKQFLNVRRTKDKQYPESTRIIYTGHTKAGVIITPDNAITIPAALAAIRFLSESIAKLPWTVNERKDGGQIERETNPVNALLRYRVSNEYSSYQFRETLMNWALRWGNGYAEIERDVLGRAIAMWPIHPSRVQCYRDTTGEIYYGVKSNDASEVTLNQVDMFHLRGFGESIVGINVVAYAAEVLGWKKAAQMFGSGFFGNGANPSGIIKMKRPLNKTQLRNLRKEFNSLYGGPNKANSTAILDNEMDYMPLSTNPDNSQFIQTNQHLIEEVCRIFGVPPHKIYHLLHASFSSLEHQSIEVVTDSLVPWERRFCDEANFKLLGQNRRNLFTDMNFAELLRGDTSTRTTYYTAMRNMGAINTNEIRAREGLPSIGPEGDLYLVQSQYTTLDNILNPPEPAPPEPVEEPDDEPDEDEETEDDETSVTVEQRNYTLFTEDLSNGGYL